VALKILAPDRVRDPAFAERFGREARTLARLAHPHIVGIHDLGERDGLYYFVMEHVDGASLREIMQAGRLSPRDALAVVPQICEALQFAHDAGVVHRDIKPENILLDRSGQVKIADFGLAKLLEPERAEDVSLTASGHVMGTPAYMAPEQIERPVDVDHRADIYAVGVVFYEMLTGELPLGRFDPPSAKVRLDVRLDQVVLRALEKEPTRRYQLASDVTADLEQLRGVDRTRDGAAPTEAAGPRQETAAAPTRTVAIDRPAIVTWIAVHSFLMAAGWAIGATGGLVLLLLDMAQGSLGLTPSRTLPTFLPPAIQALVLASGAGFALLLAIWRCVVGFGALRLRNWARYNLIVLALLELPGSLIPLVSAALIGFLPTTILSTLILVYLFRPTVARIFALGRGPATLPAAEADAVERVVRGRPLV
jgi:hypothetical protein